MTNLQGLGPRPHSLRRGGATFWFSRHGNFAKLLQQGRWAAARTARLYLNEGLALMNEMKVSPKLLLPFLGILQNSKFQPTLPRKRRPGGRGKQRKRRLASVWRSYLGGAGRASLFSGLA